MLWTDPRPSQKSHTLYYADIRVPAQVVAKKVSTFHQGEGLRVPHTAGPPRAPSPKDRTDLRAQKCQKSLRKAEWNDGSCWSNHRLSKLHPPAILVMRKNKCYIWSRKYCAERVTFRPIGKTANPSLALHSCSAPPPPLIPSPPRMKFVPLRDARRPSLKP